MSNKKYDAAIVGCGNIFKRHLESINLNPKFFELKAICDINKERLDIYSKELNVPGFSDHKKLLREMKNKINFIVIATPNSFHFEQAIDSLTHGNHILIEKPIDFSHKKTLEIWKFANKNKLEAYAVLQVRYNNTVRILKQAVEEGILGEIRSVSLTQRWQRPHEYFESWRADINIGGRTLYEVGIHYLDIVQWIFGIPKVIASASFSNKHKHVNFEDTLFSIVQYKSGASGSIEVTIASEPSNLECSLAVLGSLGYVKIGGWALDKIDDVKFSNPELLKQWQRIVDKHNGGMSLQPNSYGLYSGSCPNHPTVYKEIAEGRGITVKEASSSIKFIEEIYSKEV